MKANEIVKNLMGQKGLTQNDLQKLLNLKTQSSVSQSLNRDMKTSTLVRFLTNMNCELVIKDKNTGMEYTVTE